MADSALPLYLVVPVLVGLVVIAGLAWWLLRER